jgi:hypothetical protein
MLMPPSEQVLGRAKNWYPLTPGWLRPVASVFTSQLMSFRSDHWKACLCEAGFYLRSADLLLHDGGSAKEKCSRLQHLRPLEIFSA